MAYPGTMPHPQFQAPYPNAMPATMPTVAPAAQQPQHPSVTQRQVTYQTGEVYIGQWMQVSPTPGYPHGVGRKSGNTAYSEGQWPGGLNLAPGPRPGAPGH